MKICVKSPVFITIHGILINSGHIEPQWKLQAVNEIGNSIKKVPDDFLCQQTLTLINIKQSPVNGWCDVSGIFS